MSLQLVDMKEISIYIKAMYSDSKTISNSFVAPMPTNIQEEKKVLEAFIAVCVE